MKVLKKETPIQQLCNKSHLCESYNLYKFLLTLCWRGSLFIQLYGHFQAVVGGGIILDFFKLFEKCFYHFVHMRKGIKYAHNN